MWSIGCRVACKRFGGIAVRLAVNGDRGPAGLPPPALFFGSVSRFFVEPTAGFEPATCCLRIVGDPSAGVHSVQQPRYSNKNRPSASATLARVSAFGYTVGYTPAMSFPCCGGEIWYRQHPRSA